MVRYLIRRLLIFIPTIFLITLFSFILSLNAPGDPVMWKMGLGEAGEGADLSSERKFSDVEYKRTRKKMGLDAPAFYFSLTSLAYPDTLYRIARAFDREALHKLIDIYGNWPQISDYYESIKELELSIFQLYVPSEVKSDVIELKYLTSELRRNDVPEEIDFNLHKIDTICRKHPAVLAKVRALCAQSQEKMKIVRDEATSWKKYVPSIHWNGLANQYHRWLIKVFTLDFGESYETGQAVTTRIAESLPWTLLLNFISIILAYVIAVPIGVYSARNRNTLKDQSITTFLYILYSLPAFWVATLMITFLSNPEYLKLFPTSGVSTEGSETWSLFRQFTDYLSHMILPTICYTYTGLAFLSRQMRSSMLEVLNMDYIRTARAKGLKERTVIWRHTFRNSMLPIITHFAGIFPALIGGSIILESIFAIPGMGSLIIFSIDHNDHPVIIAIFTLTGILTMVGILISDILYAWADPRISFTRK